MPPEALSLRLASLAERLPPAWQNAMVRLGSAWLALILAFLPDWAAMADQWWNSSTYNHIVLVPAIIAWLVWQRWPQLRELTPQGWIGGLLPLSLALVGWVLGTFAGFNLLRQAAVVAMLPSTALLLLGPRVFSALLFPVAYMAFLVPFGDELVPPLQTITAKLTIDLVGLSGVPAVVDGVFIDTPAGLFEVAEACSGVKFLIAMIALGTLVANVGFRSWPRRAGFMALCILVPILANGVRAWGTIYAAQFVGIERAAGIDHLIYGWIFFALVIAAVLGISWKFFDRGIDEPMIDGAAIHADPRFARFEGVQRGWQVLLLAPALLIGAGIGWSALAERMRAPLSGQVFLPQVAGWERADYAPIAPWEPRAGGADHRLLGSYRNGQGQRVDVFYALYSAQTEGKEAGGFGEGALRPNSGWSWTSAGPPVAHAKSERLLHNGATPRLALTWYRSGDLLTGSNIQLKLANISDRLLLRAQPTAVLIVSSEQSEGNDPASALVSFRTAVGEIGPWMDRIGEGR
jgi:exosortase A